MRLAVCDDIENDRKDLIEKLKKYFDDSTIIDEAETIDKMCELLKVNHYDLIFQDLFFGNSEDEGVDIYDHIINGKLGTYIVYYTTLRECTKRTYGENVLWILHKPIEDTDLQSAIKRFFRAVYRQGLYLNTKDNTGKNINSVQVDYIYSKGNYTYVHLDNGFTCSRDRKRLYEWEEELKPHDFVRISRDYIVNLYYVKNLYKKNENGNKKYSIKTFGNEFLKISEKYSDNFVEKRTDYLIKMARKI